MGQLDMFVMFFIRGSLVMVVTYRKHMTNYAPTRLGWQARNCEDMFTGLKDVTRDKDCRVHKELLWVMVLPETLPGEGRGFHRAFAEPPPGTQENQGLKAESVPFLGGYLHNHKMSQHGKPRNVFRVYKFIVSGKS